MLGFFRNNFGFGGNNGLTDFKDILGFNVQAAGTRAALFFISCVALALGGYCMGMYLLRQIGTRGVYGNADLPDSMGFLNWKQLPWYWSGFNMFPFAALMALAVPALLACVLGWFAFRSRVTGVYLSIITQAMTFALFKEFFRNDFGFGGNTTTASPTSRTCLASPCSPTRSRRRCSRSRRSPSSPPISSRGRCSARNTARR